MNTWTERDGQRVRAAAEHKGVSVFADMSLRDALSLVSGLCAVLGIWRARKRRAKALRRKYGRG